MDECEQLLGGVNVRGRMELDYIGRLEGPRARRGGAVGADSSGRHVSGTLPGPRGSDGGEVRGVARGDHGPERGVQVPGDAVETLGGYWES